MTTAGDCQKCGTVLSGAYCTACGQKADVRILSLPAFIVDVAGDLCDFDARIWRSLRTLAFRPGRLTRLYLQGQRAKYTPPFRMYVITSLAFFVLFSLVRSLAPTEPQGDAELARAETQLPGVPSESGEVVEGAPDEQQTFSITIDDDDLECNFNPTRVGPALRERLEAACERVESSNASSFGTAFTDNFPVTMLVFIPIVAAIMKLLYLFTRRKYVEHLLFFVHVHTFFFVVALVTVLLASFSRFAPVFEIPLRIVGAAVWLYFLAYLYLAMREVYGQSHRLTAVKYVVLGVSYFLAAVLTLLGAVVFTAVTL